MRVVRAADPATIKFRDLKGSEVFSFPLCPNAFYMRLYDGTDYVSLCDGMKYTRENTDSKVTLIQGAFVEGYIEEDDVPF